MSLPVAAPAGRTDDEREIPAAINRVLAGESGAYRIVVERMQHRVLRFARGLAGEDTAAKELAHAAFVRAYTSLHSYDPSRPFYPWLARIVFRLAQDRWAESTRSAQAAPLTGDESAPADEGNPLRVLEDDERRTAIWKAIDGLSRAERAAVLLHYRDETSVEDAARVLGVSPGTVKTLLHRGRNKLRERLKEYR